MFPTTIDGRKEQGDGGNQTNLASAIIIKIVTRHPTNLGVIYFSVSEKQHIKS